MAKRMYIRTLGDEEGVMSHPLPVTLCQVKLQEAKGRIQEIMRFGYMGNSCNGL